MKPLPHLALIITLIGLGPVAGQGSSAEQAVALEARLKESAEASPTAARIMLDLLELYAADEQVFGLIRTAGKFSRAQPEHPKRPEVIVRLLEAYAVSARHDDVIATGRQFLEKYPKHQLANTARGRLADTLERTGRTLLAAERRDANWRNSGPASEGVQALKLYRKANNAQASQKATALARAMVEKLPASALLAEVGLDGLDFAGRAEQWADGLAIAKSLEQRKAPLTADGRREVTRKVGQYQSRLGQHGNAVGSFRKALAAGRDDVHRELIGAMVAAQSPPATIEKEARAYLAAYPRHEDRYEPLGRAAHACAQAKDLSKARALALEVLAHDVEHHDLPRNFVNWCGEDHAAAERGLLGVIGKNDAGAPTLRAVLALDVYRDRMKDAGKSRRMAQEFLSKSPADSGTSGSVVGHLLESAPSEDAFRKDLALLVKCLRAHPRLSGLQESAWSWTPKDKARARLWQQARKDLQGDQTMRLWRQVAERGGKSGQACQQLLQRNPTAEQRRFLMHRLAYVYRHHLGGGARKSAANHYQSLCQAFPKELGFAAEWLEAAEYAEKEKAAQQLAAAKHLLTIPPGRVHPDTWVRLVGTKDHDVIRKALPWITKSEPLSQYPLYGMVRLGDLVAEAGLKDEAVAWWKQWMDADPNHNESVGCAQRVAATLPPEQALAMMRKRFAVESRLQGSWAGSLANTHFKSGDFDRMAQVLAESRKRALARPFTDWTLSYWTVRPWVDTARSEKEWPPAKKARIYAMVRDLRLGRISAEAGLLLLAEAPRNFSRLRDAQDLILLADQHYESWNRLWPHAQAALAREDYPLGATILNGLLHTIRSVGKNEMDTARTELRKAYGKMGSLGSDIPADSPIAPLLQILLHLRLGEDDLAELEYYKNRKLFDEHREDLPIELILFAAESHIAQGTTEDHDRAEDILRGWLIKFGESDKVETRDKARVQLLLARKYQRSLQFDIARAEFTSVLNLYKDQPEAIEARFGIGETYMAQKVYDQAEEIFVALSESPNPQITIRAEFLRGVLAIRQDDNQAARRIFLDVLERVPDTELANETLYNLAEVYGIEQRYLTQLETLRTVGRLGRESKSWHTPGNALSVVVQDPDLGISRGETRIPVLVTTDPGGDREPSFLVSGGAGKGIFLTEIPTALGQATPEDGTLQVTGGDVIRVDYPEEFKKQFQFEFLSSTELRVASDGALEVASSQILNEEDESFTEALAREVAEEQADDPKAIQRPRNQVKPGNLVYVQVKDGDRDLTPEPDGVSIQLTASSGDGVQVRIPEESQHGGLFSGTVRTGELPAGARASDTALDHSPLMAIDHDEDSTWRSEPDGAAPKWLAIDLKELRDVERVALHSPDAERESPARMHLRGSHDGRFYYTLAQFPAPPEAAPITFPNPEMRLRVYKTEARRLKSAYQWKEFVDLVEKVEAAEDQAVETLSWEPPAEGEEAFFLVWSGPFIQERDGGMRFEVAGTQTALMIDGRLELPPGEGGRTVDIFAKRGVHQLTAVAVVSAGGPAGAVLRARENPQVESVSLRPFKAADLDPDAVEGLERISAPVGGTIAQEENRWILTLPTQRLRFIDCQFLEYRGEAIAISHVEVAGGGATHVPPEQDVLELAANDILELAPGDTVEISYIDELTAEARQRNRRLTKSLTATYYNGLVTPVSYDFDRAGGGSVQASRKELMRIDPGERIVAEVVDFDLDTGLERDEVEVQVQLNGEAPLTLTAVETGPSTGIFVAEIDTAADAQEDRLVVKPGDRVYLRYEDRQNTFPGHAFHREAVVYVNEPTEAVIQVVESHREPEGQLQHVPVEEDRPADFVGKVAYQLPFTVEVIDPDQAKDSRSTVIVDVETTQGTTVQVECVLSRKFAVTSEDLDEVRNPALFEGRFVGQVPLMLGSPTSPPSVPADGSVPTGGLGRIVPPPVDEEEALLEGGTREESGVLVLNVNGEDKLSARYQDERRPAGEPTAREARAALFSPATLRITDEDYQEDAEVAFVGKKLFLWLEEPDRDVSGERDKAMVRVVTASGEDETLELEETLSHSGVFTGSFPLKATPKPLKGNTTGEIECFFGDQMTVGYLDNVPQTADGAPLIQLALPVALGTDGEVAAFSKIFKNEDLAIQTQFHIAESYFELFKSHLRLERAEEAQADLQAGQRVLRELQEDYPNPKYAPRVSYLLGQFAQEMEAWDDAIAAYKSIVSGHPEHELAPDAQYKLGQCYEQAGQLDEALESYVTLAATYPKSPLIANVMLRINEHFYQKEDFAVAASVGRKFLERFPNHEWTPKMAFRIGQCHYKEEEFEDAGLAFDEFVKRFPDEELTAQALFWAGESYRMDKNIPNAFRRYNRCRWDFPESDAAKYSRGRLALPELLAQFEREANLGDE